SQAILRHGAISLYLSLGYHLPVELVEHALEGLVAGIMRLLGLAAHEVGGLVVALGYLHPLAVGIVGVSVRLPRGPVPGYGEWLVLGIPGVTAREPWLVAG